MTDILEDIAAARAQVATWDLSPMPPEWEEVIPKKVERRPTRINDEISAHDMWKKRRKWDRRAQKWVIPIVILLLAMEIVTGPAGRTAEAGGVVGEVLAHSASPACPTLRRGFTGKSVEELQYRLRLNGWILAVDGDFGPRTEYIVIKFQEFSGLYTDGIVGPRTQKALGCGASVVIGPTSLRVISSKLGDNITRWYAVAIAVGWSENDWSWLSCVIRRESNGVPSAYNGRGNDRSYGLMQLNTKGSLWSWYLKQGLSNPQQLLDGATNLRIAKIMYSQMGKRPWRSSTKPC